MKTLIKNGKVINVFTKESEKLNILIEDDKIIGTGDYCDADADIVNDVKGKYVCPGFIDGHIHIESTMLLPSELARVLKINERWEVYDGIQLRSCAYYSYRYGNNSAQTYI